MSPSFLNLEKAKSIKPTLQSVLIEDQEVNETESVLTAIMDFYSDLYACHDQCSEAEIQQFLNEIPSLPWVMQDSAALTVPITSTDIVEAIASLWLGKSPGCDGLTAEFYKAFEDSLTSILTKVFDHVWHNKSLSPSQKVAIIILLYKKGDAKLLANYRPMSLTNADYKILAYVLTAWLTSYLTDVIAVNQTTYMKGHFISTNIHSVQDTLDHIVRKSWISLVLFLDFKKAFDSVSH